MHVPTAERLWVWEYGLELAPWGNAGGEGIEAHLSSRGGVKEARQVLSNITLLGVGKEVCLGSAGAAAVDVGLDALAVPLRQHWQHIIKQGSAQLPGLKASMPDMALQAQTRTLPLEDAVIFFPNI